MGLGLICVLNVKRTTFPHQPKTLEYFRKKKTRIVHFGVKLSASLFDVEKKRFLGIKNQRKCLGKKHSFNKFIEKIKTGNLLANKKTKFRESSESVLKNPSNFIG